MLLDVNLLMKTKLQIKLSILKFLSILCSVYQCYSFHYFLFERKQRFIYEIEYKMFVIDIILSEICVFEFILRIEIYSSTT